MVERVPTERGYASEKFSLLSTHSSSPLVATVDIART